MDIVGYVVVDGVKYFCGMGNTKRTARACAEGNVMCCGLDLVVRYKRFESFTEDWPHVSDLEDREDDGGY